MLGLGAISTPMWSKTWNSNSVRPSFPRKSSAEQSVGFLKPHCSSSAFSLSLSTFHLLHCGNNNGTPPIHFSLKASASSSSGGKASRFPFEVGSPGYTEEPTTNVKFQTSLSLPGCSGSLSLLGAGYREKVFAIIGVKVYAAGLYINESVASTLNDWKGQSADEIQGNSALFRSIFQAPLEKSLQIVLVRDVDGKTFWDALDEAISPRIKSPTQVDESALSTFRSIFQGRNLKKGTFIFLTWLDPSKMLVSISSDGIPSCVDATIESENVTFALFDVFLGDAPVSPSLKASVSNGIASILK